MGGGVSSVSIYYGKERKTSLAMGALERTAGAYGFRLGREGRPNTIVVSDKEWERRGYSDAAAFYRLSTDTLYIRRKYFAGRATQSVITHEIGHSYSGPRYYFGKESVSAILEEGAVEYLTEGSRTFGYVGRGRKYARGYISYYDERRFVGRICRIIGRAKFLRLWHEGFLTVNKTPTVKRAEKKVTETHREYQRAKAAEESTYQEFASWNSALVDLQKVEKRNKNYRRLANALSRRGHKRTAKIIRKHYEDPEHKIAADDLDYILYEESLLDPLRPRVKENDKSNTKG